MKPLSSVNGTIQKMLFIDEPISRDKWIDFFEDGFSEKQWLDFISDRNRPLFEILKDVLPNIQVELIVPYDFDFPSPHAKFLQCLATISDEYRLEKEEDVFPVDIDFEHLGEQLARCDWFESDQICVNDPFLPSDWIQDSFVVLSGESREVVLLNSYYFWERSSETGQTTEGSIGLDTLVSSYLSAILSNRGKDIYLKYTKYLLVGGNVISGDDCIFIGMDILIENFKLFRKDAVGSQDCYLEAREMLSDMAISFGCSDVICLGLKPLTAFADLQKQDSSLFHLDQFFTFAGKNRRGKFRVLLGKHYKWNGVQLDWLPQSAVFHESQKYLNNICQWLSTEYTLDNGSIVEFEVLPVPIFMYRGRPWYSANCHLMTMDGKLHAVVPQYAIEDDAKSLPHLKADEKIAALFGNAGIEVILVPARYLDVAASAMAGLHCLTKVLTRTNLNASVDYPDADIDPSFLYHCD